MKPLLFAAIAAAPFQLAAAETAAGGLRIGVSGSVPVICRATIEAVPNAAPGTVAGSLVEFCNSPGGHSVYLDHSPALAGVTARVDGAAVPLSASGITLLSQSPVPTRTRKALEIELPTADAALTVRVVPN